MKYTPMQVVATSRSTAFVEELAASVKGGVHAALNSLTSPGMVAATLAVMAPGEFAVCVISVLLAHRLMNICSEALRVA